MTFLCYWLVPYLAVAGNPCFLLCLQQLEQCQCALSASPGDPAGRHVVIVDDLVQTGGTLIECAKVQHW